MPAIARILVPVDCSEESREALDLAMFFGAQFGATVDVLRVWEPPAFGTADLLVNAHGQEVSIGELGKREAEAELERFLSHVNASEVGGFSSKVAVGSAASVISRVAGEAKHDLIVIGTHGRTGVRRALLGSVAEKVVRLAPCAVLTTRIQQTQDG